MRTPITLNTTNTPTATNCCELSPTQIGKSPRKKSSTPELLPSLFSPLIERPRQDARPDLTFTNHNPGVLKHSTNFLCCVALTILGQPRTQGNSHCRKHITRKRDGHGIKILPIPLKLCNYPFLPSPCCTREKKRARFLLRVIG